MSSSEVTLLLVEDESSVRQLCETRLRRSYRVLAAGSADEALEHIQAQGRIDLLITDLQIPAGESGKVDPMESPLLGLIVAQEFRRKFRRAPILAWSHAKSPEVIPRVQKLGNARFLSKQCRWEAVEEVIEESLGGFRSGKRPRVFLVHGHDEQTMREVRAFIETDLRFPAPIVLRDEPSRNLTVIEKLERSAEEADLVFVLLTPDDEALGADGERTLRARQNVIFELGYFVGALGRHTGRVLILSREPVELPSDIHGIICIDISGGLQAARAEICQEVGEWLR